MTGMLRLPPQQAEHRGLLGAPVALIRLCRHSRGAQHDRVGRFQANRATTAILQHTVKNECAGTPWFASHPAEQDNERWASRKKRCKGCVTSLDWEWPF